MKLRGTLEERLAVLDRARWQLLRDGERVTLADEDVRVEVSLSGPARCIKIRFEPNDIQLLRKNSCADFVLLIERGEGEFEAHVLEHKQTVSERSWSKIQEQLEWAMARTLALAGLLDLQIRGVTAYTAFRNDKLSSRGSPNPAGMKIPIGDEGKRANDDDARRCAEARRSWERGRIRMEIFGRDVEHRPLPTGDGPQGAVVCGPRSAPRDDESRWLLVPALRS